ncbi:MAG: DUF4197 domain-containing protein [Deltaproteobacteria bacterium]|nr:DUF4197 domain-containing protein [Deltaproteobacteria bacterium]
MLLSGGFLFVCGNLFAGSNLLESGKGMLNQLSKQSPEGATAGALSDSEIGAGLKEALRIGSETVVAQLGKTDGFNTDSLIHIPLPEEMQTVKKTLSKVGLSGMLDDLELRLNRAAEVATPKAKELFSQAINEMSIDDVQKIYQGPEDAATQYFRAKMTPELTREMTPVVEESLSQVGAIKAYDDVMGEYKNIPFMPNVDEDLNGYVVEKGMDGIFYYLAREEAAIRSDPVKQSTALLKKLFGSR